MSTPDPGTFAEAWTRAWNAHDVEASSTTSTAMCCSPPRSPRSLCPTVGVQGKTALRQYWRLLWRYG
ncbi:hypothetical protein [Mycobacterium deserti]|uniref:hypothetical protein n=1 Tax=Mycobacterium deserti TaxID=2978347 RepID=UPI0036F2F4A3